MVDDGSGPIVVGVDGSVFSRAALRWAVAEGRQWSVPVVAVMAWHRAGPGTAGPDLCQRLLDDTVHRACAGLDGPIPATRLIAGLAADVLVEWSRHARLLALGSHGHGWLRGSVIGSVADHCVRNAACPVLVIPAGIVPAEPEPKTECVPASLLPDQYGFGPI